MAIYTTPTSIYTDECFVNSPYKDSGTSATTYTSDIHNSAYVTSDTVGLVYRSLMKDNPSTGQVLSGIATKFLYDSTNSTIVSNKIDDMYVNAIYDNDNKYTTPISNYILNDVLHITGTYGVYGGGIANYALSEADRKRNSIRANLHISVISRACPIGNASAAERVAMDTLREMVSESDYRKYLKHGFLMVQGSSGDMFQVFRDRSHTKVWRDGKVIEEICVRIKDASIPPTDNVIAFKTLIEIDDESFKIMGNRFPMGGLLTCNNQAEYRIAA
jgi:hypothetical protein